MVHKCSTPSFFLFFYWSKSVHYTKLIYENVIFFVCQQPRLHSSMGKWSRWLNPLNWGNASASCSFVNGKRTRQLQYANMRVRWRGSSTIVIKFAGQRGGGFDNNRRFGILGGRERRWNYITTWLGSRSRGCQQSPEYAGWTVVNWNKPLVLFFFCFPVLCLPPPAFCFHSKFSP